MADSKAMVVTCACSKRKKFTVALEIEVCSKEDSQHTIQHACPSAHESYCQKYLSITLPPGIRPKVDFTNRYRRD